MSKDFEHLSYRNLVLHFRDQLLYIHKYGKIPESLTGRTKSHLRKYDIIMLKKGRKEDTYYLANKAKNILINSFSE